MEYEDGRFERLLQAPKSYRKVKRVIFAVDDEGFVERVLRLWVEQPTSDGRRWLVQREAKRVLTSLASRQDLWNDLYLPNSVDEEVHKKLGGYLSDAKKIHRREFDRKVLETAHEAMNKAGEFRLLEYCGESLDNPPQW